MARTLQARLDADIGESVHISVTGLSKTLRALSAAGTDAGDLKELMHEVGEVIARPARARAPVKSGRLRNSIRSGRGKTKAVVRAGGAKVPYAGVIHYGWPRHNISPAPFITDALASQQGEVFRTFEEGINALLKKHNLK